MVIPGHNLGNSQVSVNRTIGPTLVCLCETFLNDEFSNEELQLENYQLFCKDR